MIGALEVRISSIETSDKEQVTKSKRAIDIEAGIGRTRLRIGPAAWHPARSEPVSVDSSLTLYWKARVAVAQYAKPWRLPLVMPS